MKRFLPLALLPLLLTSCNVKIQTETKMQPNEATAISADSGKKIIGARLQVKAEKVDEFIAAAKACIAASRAEPGCASYTLLQDPYDNSVTDQPIGTGDGTTATFQLGRTFNLGGTNTFFEPIYVVRGTPVVKVAGVSSAFFTLGNQGQITFSGGHIPTGGQAITWTGSFLFWVNFFDDTIEPEQAFANLWSLSGLELESNKP